MSKYKKTAALFLTSSINFQSYATYLLKGLVLKQLLKLKLKTFVPK